MSPLEFPVRSWVGHILSLGKVGLNQRAVYPFDASIGAKWFNPAWLGENK
jgi:hypothetical protein